MKKIVSFIIMLSFFLTGLPVLNVTAETNLILNPGFEITSGAGYKTWSSSTGWGDGACAFVEANSKNSGIYSLKLSDSSGTKNPYVVQRFSITGGAEYELSFYASKESGACEPLLKMEFYNSEGINVTQSALSAGKSASSTWTRYTDTFTVSQDATEVSVLVRILGAGIAYFDDLSMIMINGPDPFSLETDWVFYYSEWKTGTASVSANSSYYPDLSSAMVDFQLTDGQTVLMSKKNVAVSAGKATVSFDLSLLSEKKKEYFINATVFDGSGNSLGTKTRSVYKYDRPRYLGADGVYMKNGTEAVNPVFAYHCGYEEYPKAKLAGINIFQGNAFPTASGHLTYLNAAEKKGVMVLVPLYYNMLPAGNSSNIERNTEIINTIKNHPALFGYAIMDEPFLGLQDPREDLENSYKLVRDLDENHPVYAVEALSSYYRECAKYVDILAIDPYGAATSKFVSSSTKNAVEAVEGKKPVYTLLEAFRHPDGRYPSGNDERNMIYQALISGAAAVGFYSISDSEKDENGKYTIPIYEVSDIWTSMTMYADLELKETYDHFVFNKTPKFNECTEGDFWYSSWINGNDIYMAVLGMVAGETLSASIPLVNYDRSIEVGSYKAQMIAGGDSGTSVGCGMLNVTLHGSQTILFKITPDDNISEISQWLTLYNQSFEEGNVEGFSGGEVTEEDKYSGIKGLKLVNTEEDPVSISYVTGASSDVHAKAELYLWFNLSSFESGSGDGIKFSVTDNKNNKTSETGYFNSAGKGWRKAFCLLPDYAAYDTSGGTYTITVTLSGKGKVYLDDISFGINRGCISNGDFEAQMKEGNPGDNDRVWSFNGGEWENSQYVSLEKENSNTYMKITGVPTSSYISQRFYNLEYGRMYKLSYETKTSHAVNNANAVYFIAGETGTAGSSVGTFDSLGRVWSPNCYNNWTMHEVYFINYRNFDNPSADGTKYYSDIRFAGNVGTEGAYACFDDIKLEPVYESVTFTEESGRKISSEYLYPESNFTTPTFKTMVALLYKYENDVKSLHDVKVIRGSAYGQTANSYANGTKTKTGFLPLMLSADFTIPESLNGENYKVEVLAWDSINEMQPSIGKAVYSYVEN